MSGDGSRIDVHINVNDAAVSTERLNRAIRNQPAYITDLNLNQSAEPNEPTRFRADGTIEQQADADTDIPAELYIVGKVVETINRDSPCLVSKIKVDSSDFEPTFKLNGHITQ